MAKYRIQTDKGVYEVETAEAQPQVESAGIGAQIGTGVTDLLKGIGSGVFSTVRGAAKLTGVYDRLGERGLSDLVKGDGKTSAQRYLDALATPPDSNAGRIGNVIEQGAEYMVPGTLVARGAKLLQGGSKVAQLAGRAGLEGLSAAGVAGVQTGGDAEAMRNAALTAGGATAAIGGLSAAAPKIAASLKQGALRQYGRVLNPTKEKTKAMADKIIPQMVERGIVATTLPGMLEKSQGRMRFLGQKIDDVWDAMDVTGTMADVRPILQHLDDAARETYYTTGANGQLVVKGKVAEQGLKELESIGETLLSAAAPNSATGALEIPIKTLREFRQYWDEVANKAGAFTSDLSSWTRGKAHKFAGDAIREELAKATPDLAALNREFSFWNRVADVTESTLQRRTGQAKPLTRRLAQLGGTAGGAAAGGPLGAVLGSVAMDQLQGLMISPAWGTASAVFKDRLANAIAKGSRGEAEFYIRKLASSAGATAVTPRSAPALQPAQ